MTKVYLCFMNYDETINFLFSQLPAYHIIGKAAYKNNLENTLALDDETGHPHRKFLSIHIAGTNGKGSVSHMLSSILQEAGYTTGLYTSPHLVDFRERIKIDGKMIPRDDVVGFVNKYRSFIGSLKPSFFEMTVAMAFDFFAGNKVDVAVIETGLGGRLDSTNIITPVISVITNIGHDHMDLLGDSLEKIAAEKAGIIKDNVPVVIGETQIETSGVFISKASETRSEIEFADSNFNCVLNEGDITKGERNFTIHIKLNDELINGVTVLGGDYQAKNIVTVFQVMNLLKERFAISEDNIRNGIRNVIANTGLAGRWQILSQQPLTVCDTGHNKEGLEYVVRQIARISKRKLHMIIGFVNDKDLSMVLPLLPADAVYYFTKASVSRALDENILNRIASEYGLRGSSYPDVKKALSAAKEAASSEDMIFIGGSTFIVGDVLA